MKKVLLLTDEADGALTRAIGAAIEGKAEIIRPAERTMAEVHRLLPDADVVVGDWTGQLVLGADESELGTDVALIQQPGVGVNYIDLAAWAAKGVPVANTPGANAASVAEWAVTAASTLSRSMNWADNEVRAGRWPQEEIVARACRDLSDNRIGLVGFGDIGQRAAHLFTAFGCDVMYTAQHEHTDASARFVSLDELLEASSIVVLAVPLTAETTHMIGSAELAKMQRGSFLINVARGGVVDEEALVEALGSGHLGGAALDVFGSEPLSAESKLREFDNVLLSPHAAGGTTSARIRIGMMTLGNIVRVVDGGKPEWVVNGVH